jgi:hypothetical protein
MINYRTRLIDWLEHGDGVIYLLGFHVFVSRTSSRMVASYASLLESFTRKSSPELPALPRQATDALPWDWRHFPAWLDIGNAYTRFTSCYMAYAMVRTLFLDELSGLVSRLSEPLLGMPGHCVLMGRFIFHSSVNRATNVMFAGYHLFWRHVVQKQKRPYDLTAILFLFQTGNDLRRFYDLVGRNHSNNYSSKIRLASCDLAAVDRRKSSRHHSNSMVTFFKGHERDRGACRLSTVCTSASTSGQQQQQQHCPDQVELLLRHSMCYQVNRCQRYYYKLRPNRTPEARHLLIERLMVSFGLATKVFCFITFIVLAHGLFAMTADVSYLTRYAGCSSEFDSRKQKHSPQLGITYTYTHHRLVSGLADLFENFVIWSESGLALIYVPVLADLLNYDLLLYWSSLQTKLELLLVRFRSRHSLRIQTTGPLYCDPLEFSALHEATVNAGRRSADWAALGGAGGEPFSEQLEIDMVELQFELADFFHELARVDSFVSDVLTVVIGIWLSSCAMVSYNSLTSVSFPNIILLGLIVGFFIVTLASHFLLTLRRCCLRSYVTLCSLIAYSHFHKRSSFVKMLDFFVGMNRTTYTLAHRYPYKSSTFISIIGYSLSCFLITVTLFGRPRPVGQLSGSQPTGGYSSVAERLLNHMGMV